MVKKILRVGAIVCFILLSPLIYSYVHSFLTSNVAFPLMQLLSVTSKTIIAIIFLLSNSISAIVTALLTAFPCGFLAKTQKISSVLVVTTLGFPLYVTVFQPDVRASNLIVFDLFGQCIAVILSMIIFAEIGLRVAQQRERRRGQV